MGDRNNPIKFGPEWLRNLARERSAGASTTNSSNAAATSGNSSSGPPGALGGATASTSAMTGNISNTAAPKVLLAKLRYGREEMLALYERTSEAPQELKYIDFLYQPRGKPPVALNNTFEDDMREAMRSGPPIGVGLATGERFGTSRSTGRGQGLPEGRVEPTRGRARLPFVRQLSTGRGTSWHVGAPKMPGYSGGADDDSSSIRSWNSSNGGNATARTSSDQTEWAPNKMFRSKRPGSNTNWRSATRDDGEEWRSSDTSTRSRSNQQEKWERDWGDRPSQDKTQSWNANRRSWVGGDTQNSDDNLPEWANENAEACSGTFDSSGAFHGYSNDDTNLPKSQDPIPYALTRSHTHGSFVRSKTAEEGSDEWWASEKAKILSPKRFDASEIKFNKKPSTGVADTRSSTSSNNKQTLAKEDTAHNKIPEKPDTAHASSEPPESNASGIDSAFNKKKVRFAESKTFDSLMRSDINLEEANDERCNFQSVMITPNNSLRQKHQNIVQSANNKDNRQQRNPGMLMQLMPGTPESDLTPQGEIVLNIMGLSLEDKEMLTNLVTSSENPPVSVTSPGKPSGMALISQMAKCGVKIGDNPVIASNQCLIMFPKANNAAPGIQAPGIQNIGLTNSALNASLGLPIGNSNIAMGQTIGMPHGVPPSVLSNQGLSGNSMVGSGIQAGGTAMPDFQTNNNIPGMPSGNVANNSLYLRHNSNNSSLQSQNNIPMPNPGNQSNMFPTHALQHSASQASFGSSMYGNIMQQSSAPNTTNTQNLAEQWYYEDPKKIIQGPFSSKDMYSWYRAGFFSPSLMVRRACDPMMRPLGSYGPMVPFAQMELLSFPLSSGYEVRNQGPHDSMLTSQPGLGLDIDSLWGQASSSPDLMWMQRAASSRNETQVNQLPVFFWDQQPSTIAPNSLLPDAIAKDVHTEDEILAQLRASRGILTPPNVTFLNEQTPVTNASNIKSDDTYNALMNITPNLNELQRIMNQRAIDESAILRNKEQEKLYAEQQVKSDKPFTIEHNTAELNIANSQQVQTKVAESKVTKQPKTETDKAVKNKENNTTKSKNKKIKDEKIEELSEFKSKEEDNNKVEKSSGESSPTKNKKELKKELEKEKKEWIKEGFTIVKGPEKNSTKDIKKKLEELHALEEAERKRKEEERPHFEEDTKRKPVESTKKQELQQQQRQISEAVAKKAPWSAVSVHGMQATGRDGMTLAEIQRLEREKKLEQMKEQQQMMQIIAQQQAAALAREQEMQAGLGWAKMKGNNLPGQHLLEIQAEARKQAVAAAAPTVASQAEEALTTPPLQVNLVPWNTQNGGGFWDTMPSSVKNLQELPTPVESIKIKKNVNLSQPMKRDTSPAAEFDTWCNTVLSVWDTKLDVPTFVGFLKDIESPYEVKDYIKYYLGETKDSSDFARQFLERRSKLFRVRMMTPSDDLCSPAMAINPRGASSSDYQEIKGKGKKTKKNKMLKVDARILGFSVTAAEDRINVGDIDSV